VVLLHEIGRSIVQGRELSFKRSIDGLFASNVFQKLMGEAHFAIDESRGLFGRNARMVQPGLAGVCDPYALSQGAFDSGAR